MKKNDKGFTLVELLAIVVILAVIMVIAAPSMTNQIKRTEEENQSILNQKIENAAHLYAAKYYANSLIDGTQEVKFTLKQLQEDGLINLKNNCTNKLNSVITIDSTRTYIYDNIKDNNCYK